VSKIYWIEIHYVVTEHRRQWIWEIRCRNGSLKAISNGIYSKRCLCINDANSLAKELNMEVRLK